MPRFFIERIIEPDEKILTLQGDTAHHILHVLRLKAGDELVVCDGARTDHHCRLETTRPDNLDLLILSRRANQTEPAYRAVLYQGLAKGDRMDQVVQKSVELGVSQIVPVICQRSVVRLDGRDQAHKSARWQKIAAEAARQCGRGAVPSVSLPCTWADAVTSAMTADLAILPWEMERSHSIRCCLDDYAIRCRQDDRPPGTISIMIGPEGGISEAEARQATAAGLVPVSLGPRILRTETAGPAVLAMLLYRFEHF